MGILLIAYLHDVENYIVPSASMITIDIDFNCRNVEHKIHDGAFALSSTPWFINVIYMIYNLMQLGLKPGYYNPLPL